MVGRRLMRYRDRAAYAAGVSPSCRRPSHFSLLAQRKVTQRKGPPDESPSGLRPPGTRAGSGLFDGAPAPTKRNRHPCRFPCGPSLHPPAASYGARKIKSDNGRLVQLRCTSHRGRSRCSCFKTQSQDRREKAMPFGGKFSPQRSGSVARPALSPLRYGALRSASAYPLCRGEADQVTRFLSRSGLSQRHAAGVGSMAIFFGLLFFWASKRKVTRASADDRNARCVSGQVAVTRQSNTEALDPGLRRDDGFIETIGRAPPLTPTLSPQGRGSRIARFNNHPHSRHMQENKPPTIPSSPPPAVPYSPATLAPTPPLAQSNTTPTPPPAHKTKATAPAHTAPSTTC